MDPQEWRLAIFLFGLVLFLLLSWLFPKRTMSPVEGRLFHNLAMGMINPLVLKGLFSWGLVEWAIFTSEKGYGLLNNLPISKLLAIFIVIFVFDGIIYWQHRLTHRIPILWRLHRVHHTDIAFDTSTALRFHFVEIILSFFIKAFFVFLIGGPPEAIFFFEIILNFSAMFNHSNLYIPTSVDSVLRKVLVTPDFHRVHHSPKREETDSNYGFFLTIWDVFFNSYTDQPSAGHLDMAIGLDEFRDRQEQTFWSLLVQPLRSSQGSGEKP